MTGTISSLGAMLNLISDPWIPVLRRSGRETIRPDQIAEPDVLRPDWPRPDLNLACYELLIGLVYLAHPPNGSNDRTNPPDAAMLRGAMKPLAPAFNLLGDGPRFLQDLEPLEGDGNPPEMLFIDSAGDSAARKNADLMVRRGRYPALPLPLAAMALYTLQAFAPRRRRGESHLNARRRADGHACQARGRRTVASGLGERAEGGAPGAGRSGSIAMDEAHRNLQACRQEVPRHCAREQQPVQARPRGVFRPAPAIALGGPG